MNLLERLGRAVIEGLEGLGRVALLLLDALGWIVRPPLRFKVILRQMEFVGVQSLFVVVLTGAFTGAVLAFESYHAFRLFTAEQLVGVAVALSMTRELGPVLTSLMVTARAGSAMAAELGTMRITEQIDALVTMAVSPVNYLVMPRIVASTVMVPLLTVVCDVVGIAGGYVVGVGLLGIPSGTYVARMWEAVYMEDVVHGLIKAVVFGLLLALIGCYKGYYTTGGAEGVGRATTQAVVLASISILVSDYFLTAALF
ncbi:MAG TPA: ABC transporter permease [Thermodesulfobacteriota bacterium]|nr:ABC transporter permease [Thermodesulfobacteriota bacterium]